MKKNRLVLSDAAAADIIEQADWYSAQSGKALAARWEGAGACCIGPTPERPAISKAPNYMI